MEVVITIWFCNITVRHLDELGVDRRAILKWILKKQDVRIWVIHLAGVGFCEHGNEP